MKISDTPEKIIILLANKLPSKKIEPRREEWLALLEYVSGSLPKLLYSLSFFPVVLKIYGFTLLESLLESTLYFTKKFIYILLEHFRIVYFTLILAISPIVTISFITCLIMGFYGKNYSGIFILMYTILCISPSLFSIINREAYNDLLSYKFHLPEFWIIPSQYLNLWFFAKITSLIGIMFFNTANNSGRLIIIGIICIYIFLWLLAHRYSNNITKLDHKN